MSALLNKDSAEELKSLWLHAQAGVASQTLLQQELFSVNESHTRSILLLHWRRSKLIDMQTLFNYCLVKSGTMHEQKPKSVNIKP